MASRHAAKSDATVHIFEDEEAPEHALVVEIALRQTTAPALVWIVWAVICRLAGRQRKTIAAATSSGIDTRWKRFSSGPACTSASICCESSAWVMVVAVNPGATQFTLMSYGASCAAAARDMPTRADFALA